MNLANILTVSRIIVVPVIAVLLLRDGCCNSIAAAALFIMASITDFLDGHLARKYDMVTDLGKLLDPLADKLLIATSLVMLIPLGRVPAWVVAVIIGRELAVTGLRSLAAEKNVIIPADWLGKYKTSFQCAAIIPLLIHYEICSVQFQLAGEFFLWVALFFTVWSGCNYFLNYFRQARPA